MRKGEFVQIFTTLWSFYINFFPKILLYLYNFKKAEVAEQCDSFL